MGELVSTATARNTYANAASVKSLPLDPQQRPFVQIVLLFKCDRGVFKGLSAEVVRDSTWSAKGKSIA